MASFQNFRGAFNGFNREDVVHYIEFINNKHNAEINQMNTQIQALYADLESYRVCCEEYQQYPALLQQEQERSAALEQALAEVQQELEELRNRPKTDSELETYRRAERAERAANARVTQLYAQANGVLANATACTDETTANLVNMTQQVCAQLTALQDALTDGAGTIRDAANAMYAIKPITPEE